MAIIPIDDNHRIRSDSRQWIVERKTKGIDQKTGQPIWNGLSYHVGTGEALKSLAERRLRESDAVGIGECIAEMKRISQALTDAMTPHIDINLRSIRGKS